MKINKISYNRLDVCGIFGAMHSINKFYEFYCCNIIYCSACIFFKSTPRIYLELKTEGGLDCENN